MKVGRIMSLAAKYRPLVLIAFLLFIGLGGYSQTYNPTNFTVSNKSYGVAQAVSTDARSWFYDATNFIMRDYQSTTEVNNYLNLAKYRSGHFPVYVHVGGTLTGGGIWVGGSTQVWWYKDSTGNANLVRWYTDSTGVGGPFYAVANNLSEGNAGLIKGNLALDLVNNTSDATKNSATVSLTNHTIDGSLNTLLHIPNSALTNNSIGITITSLSGSDIAATTTPAALGTPLVVNFPNSGPSSRGPLTSSNWNFFNGKLDSVHISNDSVYNCVNGTCTLQSVITGAGAVLSVTNTDSSIRFVPNTGNVVGILNTTHANTWTAAQTFNSFAPIFGTFTNNGGIFYGNAGGTLQQTATSTTSQILQGGTTPSFFTPINSTVNGWLGYTALSNALGSTHLFVGNGSNVATDVPLTGDALLNNTGLLTNTGLKGAVLPSLSTGNLKYTGSVWTFDNTLYASGANNGISDSAGTIQLGGNPLIHYLTIIPFFRDSLNLIIKTDRAQYDAEGGWDTSRLNKVIIGDSSYIPKWISNDIIAGGDSYNLFNAPLSIYQRRSLGVNTTSQFSMLTYTPGINETAGIAFVDVSAGNAANCCGAPQMHTFSNDSTNGGSSGWEEDHYMRSNPTLNHFVNTYCITEQIANYDSLRVNAKPFGYVHGENLFAIINGDYGTRGSSFVVDSNTCVIVGQSPGFYVGTGVLDIQNIGAKYSVVERNNGANWFYGKMVLGETTLPTDTTFQLNVRGTSQFSDTVILAQTRVGFSTDSVLVKHGNVIHAIAQSSIGGGAISSVSNSDGTLSISPTTGAVVASLALGHANIWTGKQTQPAPIFTATASGASTDSLLTINPTTGQVTWRSRSAFNLYAANGLTAAGGDSIYWGGALNQPTNITGNFVLSLGTSGSKLLNLSINSNGGLNLTGGTYNSTQGSELLMNPSTINNAITAASGTVSNFSGYMFSAPTITSTNASIQYSNAATLRIDNSPTFSTNSSQSGSAYAIDIVAGTSHFGVGSSNFSASFDGCVSVGGAATSNAYFLNLPAASGATVSLHFSAGSDPTGAGLTGGGNMWYNGTNFYFVGPIGKTDLLNGVRGYTHTIFTPSTGGTVNLANNQYNIINPAGALATLTVNLPSSPNNNDVVYIKYTQTVSAVTYGNGTVVAPIIAPVAGGLVILTFDLGTTSWY